MRIIITMLYGAILVLGVIMIVIGADMLDKNNKVVLHKPEFVSGQCFNKAGLREPWDLDVAGQVVLHGYTKYLVLYADEANRLSGGNKNGWEEDIRLFDEKYQATPCPANWKDHTHRRDLRIK